MSDYVGPNWGWIAAWIMLSMIPVTIRFSGIAEWPWVWVTAPLWAPIAFVVCVAGLIHLARVFKVY